MKDPNKLRIPAGKSKAYGQGWRDREAGNTVNPFSLAQDAKAWTDWSDGNEHRGDLGFDTAHLPRKPFSDAFA